MAIKKIKVIQVFVNNIIYNKKSYIIKKLYNIITVQKNNYNFIFIMDVPTKPIILIISPHSECKKFNGDVFYRSCDTNAEQGSILLNDIAKKLNFETKLFLSDKPRIDKNGKILNDYNRDVINLDAELNQKIPINMRETEWRTEIRNYIDEKFKEKRDLIIYEVHSFPNSKTPFNEKKMGLATIGNYKKRTHELFDFLVNETRNEDEINNIIDNINRINEEEMDNPDIDEYREIIKEKIKENIDIADTIVDEICDIMQETSEISKKQIEDEGFTNIKDHFLLEFNESINKTEHKSMLLSIFLHKIKTKCDMLCFIRNINFYYVIFLLILLLILISINNWNKKNTFLLKNAIF